MNKKNMQIKYTMENLYRLNIKDIIIMEQYIKKKLKNAIPLINKLALYLFSSGGKRIRPLLTLSAAQICNSKKTPHHIKVATIVEFIHTATLLHDDVIDESCLRRGVKTANKIWGNQTCVLVGDYLFSKAFEMSLETNSKQIIKAIASTCSLLAEGEVSQLIWKRNIKLSKNNYLNIISHKTAALFKTSCQVGAISAQASKEQENALSQYGFNLGVAFQLIDDLLDYQDRQKKLGKKIGDDFREGKVTLPIIIAVEESSKEDMEFWQRTITNLKQKDNDLDLAIKIMNKYKSLAKVLNLAKLYSKQAIKYLDVFENSKLKLALIEAARFNLQRFQEDV